MTKKTDRDEKFEKDIITGLISLILLAIINRSKDPMYGYQIAKRMEEVNETGIELKQGTIYPVLRAMEKKGLLRSTIKASESGPPRKYYLITKKGENKLEVWEKAWTSTSTLVDNVLRGDY
jgi:PadR family transcriptional regulator PadR